MNIADWALWTLAALGHTALWFTFTNHVHATAMPWWLIQVISHGAHAVLAAGLAAGIWWIAGHPSSLTTSTHDWLALSWPGAFYVAFCALWGGVHLPRWAHHRLTRRPPNALLRQDSTLLNLATRGARPPVGQGWRAAWLHVPGNESLQLEVNEKELLVPRLPPALDGLSIAHFSDLHFTGYIDRAFFEHVVDEVNRLRADLVALTGDVMDVRGCLDWITPLLSPLRAPYGAYFVLGNHDLRVRPLSGIRQRLADAGMIDLGARWRWLEVAGERMLLAGNELPWIVPAADLSRVPPLPSGQDPLKIVLAHSPDQLRWARRHQVDLLLAGHMHGGQLAFPLVGPLVGPSRHGIRYAEGVFHEHPTLMHVSRGVSGQLPYRYGCRPEITRLVLRSAEAPSSTASPRTETGATTLRAE